MNHEPSQQSCKEECKLWRGGATQDSTHLIKKDHNNNEEVRAKIQQAIGPHEHLLTIVQRRKTAAVWTRLPLTRCGQNHLAKHSQMWKKTGQTEEEVGRQHRGMDRAGVCQVPEDSGKQGKRRKLVKKLSVELQRPSRSRDR